MEHREINIGGRVYSMDEQGNILSIYKTVSGFIKTFPDKDGYLKVAVTICKRTFNKIVHRLVYEAWVGEIPEGMTVDHIDGNKTNNHYTNLRLLTPEENARIGNAKEYLMVSPTGDVVEVYNMKKFCKANGLHHGHMLAVHNENPRYKQHKGWTKYVKLDQE